MRFGTIYEALLTLQVLVQAIPLGRPAYGLTTCELSILLQLCLDLVNPTQLEGDQMPLAEGLPTVGLPTPDPGTCAAATAAPSFRAQSSSTKLLTARICASEQLLLCAPRSCSCTYRVRTSENGPSNGPSNESRSLTADSHPQALLMVSFFINL